MIRRHLSFANVVACIALFVALGGASYAATQLPKSSVGPRQLKPNAVIASKVRDGTLTAADFAAGQLPAGPRGAVGAQGERGPAGPQGEPGPRGEQGPRGESVPQSLPVVTRYGANQAVLEGTATTLFAACAPDEVATGGGYQFTTLPEKEKFGVLATRPGVEELNPKLGLVFPAPADGQAATGWAVGIENLGATTFELRPYALCVAAG